MNETANHAGYFTGYYFSVEEGNMNKKPTKKKKKKRRKLVWRRRLSYVHKEAKTTD